MADRVRVNINFSSSGSNEFCLVPAKVGRHVEKFLSPFYYDSAGNPLPKSDRGAVFHIEDRDGDGLLFVTLESHQTFRPIQSLWQELRDGMTICITPSHDSRHHCDDSHFNPSQVLHCSI